MISKQQLICNKFKEDNHSGFTNEAKEWAGELLSGQTKVLLANNLLDKNAYFFKTCFLPRLYLNNLGDAMVMELAPSIHKSNVFQCFLR